MEDRDYIQLNDGTEVIYYYNYGVQAEICNSLLDFFVKYRAFDYEDFKNLIEYESFKNSTVRLLETIATQDFAFKVYEPNLKGSDELQIKQLEFKPEPSIDYNVNVSPQYRADCAFGRFIINVKNSVWEAIGPTYQGIFPSGGSVFKTETLALYDFTDTSVRHGEALHICIDECQRHFEYLCEQTVLE